MFSLIAWAKSQDSVHKPQFLKRRERRAEADRTKVRLLTSQAPYHKATPAHMYALDNLVFYNIGNFKTVATAKSINQYGGFFVDLGGKVWRFIASLRSFF